jgi:hypothetical protein
VNASIVHANGGNVEGTIKAAMVEGIVRAGQQRRIERPGGNSSYAASELNSSALAGSVAVLGGGPSAKQA